VPTTKKKQAFMESADAITVKSTLILMTQDSTYNTLSSYSANAVTYPDNLIPFVDKHMNYLNAHPSTDPAQYIKNLQLMTRFKK
jgi:hypothetical protein